MIDYILNPYVLINTMWMATLIIISLIWRENNGNAD